MLPATVSSSNRPRVLIADDERVIADTLALILDKGGFESCAVYTTEDALELAPQFRPDILVSDVLMTGLNGIDAAVQMRAVLPDLRVFLLSGQTATSEMIAKSHARDLGFEVLVKPVHPQELIRKLQATMVPVRSVA